MAVNAGTSHMDHDRSDANFEPVTELDAKDAIRSALLRYTRGIDRLDGEMVASAFHPGALCVDYGSEPNPIEDFVAYAIPRLREAFSATQHRISNVAIDIDGTTALSEAYVLAFHVEQTDDRPKLHTFNGRYIDQFEARAGEWKIAERTLRVDWSRIETIEQPMRGTWVESARDRSDVVYGQAE